MIKGQLPSDSTRIHSALNLFLCALTAPKFCFNFALKRIPLLSTVISWYSLDSNSDKLPTLNNLELVLKEYYHSLKPALYQSFLVLNYF